LGVGHQGKGGTYTWEEGKRIEYFVIVQSEGDTVCIYLYCIYVMKMRWLFVWHYLLPVLWFYIQCFNVDNVFWFLSLSFLVFVFLLSFFWLLHGLLLLLSNEVTQLLFVLV
jgi:hypothetical protein